MIHTEGIQDDLYTSTYALCTTRDISMAKYLACELLEAMKIAQTIGIPEQIINSSVTIAAQDAQVDKSRNAH